MSDSYRFDAIIIGAGIVGLAIAQRLSKNFDSILLVEKEESFGRHVSSRNSEVIHSGIYYPQNSLKAKLCIEGNKMLVAFARNYAIHHKICGKLVVISDPSDKDKLEALMENGIKTLMDFDFDTLLVGDGDSILSGAKTAVAEFINSN